MSAEAWIALRALLAAAAGFGFGLLYFAALRRSVAAYGGGGTRQAVALTAARLAGAVLVFGAAAWLGTLPLLAAFCGFLLARFRAVRSAAP